MAPNDVEGLRAAWRALAGVRQGDGWQTIPVTVRASCSLSAARRMPGGEEAVLVGFRGVRSLPDSRLPQGHGFEVLGLESDPTGADHLVVALARRPGGSPELFAMMAEDLVRLIDVWAASQEDTVLRRFLARIRAWQDFMNRHRESVLSAENEQGLFGELVLLEHMIEAGLPPRDVLDAWQGPVDGLQDFILGSGGIEIKTTLSTSGFPATVSSLEQLDDNLRQPLFVVATRLALHSSGMTLPEMADFIRGGLHGDREVLDTLDIRLMQAGLLGSTLERYTRRFRHVSSAILRVQGDFPRLTRTNVHPVVRKARYEIDLDLTDAEEVELERALELMGVT